jgi:hypothetical protein
MSIIFKYCDDNKMLTGCKRFKKVINYSEEGKEEITDMEDF